ncbi:suppressor of G2 allele of SKP1 [Tanacetum coccineum]
MVQTSSLEAISDANKAIELDASIPKAYLRKGTACFNLEEYYTAKTAFEAEEEGELVTPPMKATPKATLTEIVDEAPKEIDQVNNISSEVATTTPAKPKYRHEYYQKPEEVVVTVFAKGVPADRVSVNFGEQILSVTIEVPGEEPYVFQPRLFGKIVPANCKYVVLSTKIEIRLAKVEHIHWTSLEFVNNNVVVRSSNVSSGTQRPSYPSSKPTKDWDKLEALVKKEEKDEKLDGDAALNKFFRDIYSDADEDTRRAMSKSFVESNGTVLSTNWKEVGSKEVEGTAPDELQNQLLPIIAEKFNKEKERNKKLKEVKARLNFGGGSRTSQYSESRTMSIREHERRHRSRRSCSPRPSPSVFSRIRRERSRSPRQKPREKRRRSVQKVGKQGKSVSACSGSHNQHSYSKYTKALSESEDSGGGHWKSRSKKHKSSRESGDDLSQPWV